MYFFLCWYFEVSTYPNSPIHYVSLDKLQTTGPIFQMIKPPGLIHWFHGEWQSRLMFQIV